MLVGWGFNIYGPRSGKWFLRRDDRACGLRFRLGFRVVLGHYQLTQLATLLVLWSLEET